MLAGADEFDGRGDPAPLVVVLGAFPGSLDSFVSVLPVLVRTGDRTVLMAQPNGVCGHDASSKMINWLPKRATADSGRTVGAHGIRRVLARPFLRPHVPSAVK